MNPAVFQDCRFRDFQHHHCETGEHRGTEQFVDGNFAVLIHVVEKALSEYKTVSVRPFIRLTVPMWFWRLVPQFVIRSTIRLPSCFSVVAN